NKRAEIHLYERTHNRTRRKRSRDSSGRYCNISDTRRQAMEWLRRNAAPLSAKVWKEIDDIAGAMFKQTVVGRRITDFDGPRGWNHVATQLGTFKPAQVPRSSGPVRFSIPDVLLLTELRADFQLAWADIDVFERVGPRLEAKQIEDVARQIALAEDTLIFFGRSTSPGVLTHADPPRVAITDLSI